MHIYLRHPVHGTKIATMEEEAIFDESYGWNRYTPGQQSVVADVQTNELVSRRRGRRPLAEEVTRDDNDSGRSD